jgi:hypothetical protein
LGDDGADRGGDHLGVALGHDREHVAHEMGTAPLPAAPRNTAPPKENHGTHPTESIAAFRPVCASEMTSCTPARPRALTKRWNEVQNRPSWESPTSNPSTSRRPSAVTPVAITTAWDTTRRLTRDLRRSRRGTHRVRRLATSRKAPTSSSGRHRSGTPRTWRSRRPHPAT